VRVNRVCRSVHSVPGEAPSREDHGLWGQPGQVGGLARHCRLGKGTAKAHGFGGRSHSLISESCSLRVPDGSKGKWMPLKSTQFESLLEAVPGALVGMDQEGAIWFVSSQTELMFGQHINAPLPGVVWEVYDQHRDDFFADPATRPVGLDLGLVDAITMAASSRSTPACPTSTAGTPC
jgi:PAS domain-containing protein